VEIDRGEELVEGFGAALGDGHWMQKHLLHSGICGNKNTQLNKRRQPPNNTSNFTNGIVRKK
jgi:hypothetical protein